jgi:hypothetical protein
MNFGFRVLRPSPLRNCDCKVALLFRATNSSWAVFKEVAVCLVKDCNSTSKSGILSALGRAKKRFTERIRGGFMTDPREVRVPV